MFYGINFTTWIFKGGKLKPVYSPNSHLHALVENWLSMLSKKVLVWMGWLPSSSKKAATKVYFMYLLLYISMMIMMLVCNDADA